MAISGRENITGAVTSKEDMTAAAMSMSMAGVFIGLIAIHIGNEFMPRLRSSMNRLRRWASVSSFPLFFFLFAKRFLNVGSPAVKLS
jgi:hypothetical protein